MSAKMPSCSIRSSVDNARTQSQSFASTTTRDRYPAIVVEQMKELALFGATVSEEYGGLGLPATTYSKMIMTHLVGMDVCHRYHQLAPDAGACDREIRHARAKAKWLPKIVSGEVRGGLALTEPRRRDADLQGILVRPRGATEATTSLMASKTWITNGAEGSWVLPSLVKTDPQAQPRHKGMSLFIAPKQKGFTVGRKLRNLDINRSIRQNSFSKIIAFLRIT